MIDIRTYLFQREQFKIKEVVVYQQSDEENIGI